MLTTLIKDEVPKAQIYVYAINNKYEASKSDEYSTNVDTKRELMGLNSSLYFGEIMENIDILIPFDKVDIHKDLK